MDDVRRGGVEATHLQPARVHFTTGQDQNQVDQHGEPIVIEGTGFLARALQHEADHLDGRLYVDTLRGDARRQALRAIRSAPWGKPTV